MSSFEFRLKKIDLALAIISCDSISRFASLVCVPVGITSSVVGIKICAITSGIKNLSQL